MATISKRRIQLIASFLAINLGILSIIIAIYSVIENIFNQILIILILLILGMFIIGMGAHLFRDALQQLPLKTKRRINQMNDGEFQDFIQALEEAEWYEDVEICKKYRRSR